MLADLEEMGMTTLSLDVTNVESIHEAKIEVEKMTGGKLDILVNNACVYHPSLSHLNFPTLYLPLPT